MQVPQGKDSTGTWSAMSVPSFTAMQSSSSAPADLHQQQQTPQLQQPVQDQASSHPQVYLPQQQQQQTHQQPPAPLTTTQHHGVAPQNDLATLFECPVCFDYALPPIIYQCDSGHIICTTCKQKVQCCPSCRGPLGGVRNLAMEKVADSVQFPCKYVGSGCREKMQHVKKRQHEEQCQYRPYSCPCPGTTCTWQGGNLSLVLSHLLSAHKTITTLVGEDIVFLATDINLPGAVDWVMMQCCFDQYFILVLEKQERHEGHQQFFAVVQLIGSAKDAEEFR